MSICYRIVVSLETSGRLSVMEGRARRCGRRLRGAQKRREESTKGKGDVGVLMFLRCGCFAEHRDPLLFKNPHAAVLAAGRLPPFALERLRADGGGFSSSPCPGHCDQFLLDPNIAQRSLRPVPGHLRRCRIILWPK